MTADATKPYRLKPGAKHVGAKPGDLVQLTDNQAKAFADKFDDPHAHPEGGEQPEKAPGNVQEAPRQVPATPPVPAKPVVDATVPSGKK